MSLVAGVWLAACASTPPVVEVSRAPASRGPIVLIVIDTLRADRLGSYGYDRATSPVLDALAAQGVRFDRAYSQAPWTTPSIGSLLSSRYPTEIGIREVKSKLGEDLLLLPEVLEGAGFATAGVVSHDFCTGRWGFGQGFEHFDESNVLGHDAVVGHGVTDRALELIERVRDRPFFLFLHYFDPHFAYIEHEGHSFRGADVSYDGPVDSGMHFKKLRDLHAGLTPADYDEIDRLYDSEIAYTDFQIGRLLDRLRQLDLYDEATIVVTADHGEEFDDHGQLGHAKTLYDELVRVPLILKCPRSLAESPQCAAGRVVSHPVGLVDVYPTLTHVAGIEVDTSLRGSNLLGAPGAEARPVFSETSRKVELRAVISGTHKLIRDLRDGTSRLYDFDADPVEQVDLMTASPEIARETGRALDEWLAAVQFVPSQPDGLELSDEERARLTALGYLDPGAGDE